MPLASDPNARTRFTLVTDNQRPEAERATFELRFRSRSTMTEYRALLRKYSEAATHDERYVASVAAIKLYVIGWQNVTDEDGVPLPFDPDRIGDALDEQEIEAVLIAIPEAVTIGGLERRGFTSPSPDNGSASAPSAATASAVKS
jgi:hypothetical protein